jgi:hypothetical protein
MAVIINGSNIPVAGSVAVGDGTSLNFTAVGTAGQILKSNGASVPTWINNDAGTVTTASIISANGFAGTVATASTTPAITLTTTITGLFKGNGTAISAAVAGTDFIAPPSGTALLKANSGGALANAVAGTDYATPTGTETLTNKTLTSPTVTDYTETVVAIGTVTSTNTLSLASGTVQTATLTASTACTFTMPTATAGKSFVLLLKQAASTGSGTATFTGVRWNTASAPTITAAAGKMDILTFIADGTNWYGSIAQGYTP